ncbi:glycosyltransferase family 4 protein [Neobacillus sp. MER 74]|nr:glycosyltransferase family 4 protein [Neobacillus sp. MER 74]MCM3116046.1 glycosyltransferase family 4 protein [Neobacillus sp. MER 74]
MIVLGDEWNKRIKEIEPSTKTVVISNTVRIPQDTVHWSDECFQVLFLGVLIKRKGVHDLLNAISLMKKCGINNINFVIAGTGTEEENLKRQCNEMQLCDRVEFAGWTVDQKKIDLLKQSHLLVLPSYNEGLPIAILEAISYGLPVVSTKVGDIASAVVDGKNGYLVEPGDVSGLAKAMSNIVADKEHYKAMVKTSKGLAEDKFSAGKYFDLIKKLYFDLSEKD